MASAQPLVDHDRIREWAEARGARPARVKGTGGKNDPGMLRLDFPGYSGKDSLQAISWNDWFRRFDERKLALLVQVKTARGGRMSNFNKLVERGASASGRSRSMASSRGRKTASSRGRKTASSRTRRTASARTRKSTKPSGTRQASARGGAAKSTVRQKASKSTRSSRPRSASGSRRASGSRKRASSPGGRRRQSTGMSAEK